MRNKYSGTCYRCGKVVAPGDGHFERLNGQWLVQHATCAIQFRGTNTGKEQLVSRALAGHRDRMEILATGTGKAARNARRFLKRVPG